MPLVASPRTECTLQLEDRYGSPSLDEVSIFSRNFSHALEAKVGEKAAGELSVEVSSPVSPFIQLSDL